jgi:HNH endonuclease
MRGGTPLLFICVCDEGICLSVCTVLADGGRSFVVPRSRLSWTNHPSRQHHLCASHCYPRYDDNALYDLYVPFYAMSLAREPPIPPSTPTRIANPNCQILFRHPGYDDSNNVLLKLFAPDPAAGASSRGLYAQYALEACGTIAGNRWDGWLSESKDPAVATIAAPRVEPTSILQKSSYYFHLPPLQNDIDIGRANAAYPIVPTFREWRFPHDQLPDSWKRIAPTDPDLATPEQSFATSNLTLALQARDVSCRITGCREGTQVAHICPQNEADWWYNNAMSRYNMGSANTIDDLSNALLLRTDLHIAFDKPKFVFVPKPSADPEYPQLVTHLLEPSAELEYLYHNRRLQSMHSSIQVLFARFAWSIFPLLDGFLTCRVRRRLLLANEIVEESAVGDGFVSWEKCAQFSRKRSRSPKKRRPDADVANAHETSYAVGEEEDSRPRKRNRKGCSGIQDSFPDEDQYSTYSDSRGRKRCRQPYLSNLHPSSNKEKHYIYSESRLHKFYHHRHPNHISPAPALYSSDPPWNGHRPGSASPPLPSPEIQPVPLTQDSSQLLGSPNGLSQSRAIRSTVSPTHIPSTPNSPGPSLGNGGPPILIDADATLADASSTLAQTWLAHERLRSDPHKYWENEKAWAENVWSGNVTLDEEAARRWLEICGCEFPVMEGE